MSKRGKNFSAFGVQLSNVYDQIRNSTSIELTSDKAVYIANSYISNLLQAVIATTNVELV